MAATHLVLYDGDCALCHGAVRFVASRDRGGEFEHVSLQSEEAMRRLRRFGGYAAFGDTFLVLANADGPAPSLLARSEAALFIGSRLGGPWSFAAALARWLPRGLRDRIYDAVARRRRSRFFGMFRG